MTAGIKSSSTWRTSRGARTVRAGRFGMFALVYAYMCAEAHAACSLLQALQSHPLYCFRASHTYCPPHICDMCPLGMHVQQHIGDCLAGRACARP